MTTNYQNNPGEGSTSSEEAQTQALLQQALAYSQQGQLAQAQSLCESLLKIQPRHFDGLHLLGCLALQTNRHPKAVELISRALEINPTSELAHFNMALALHTLKRLEEAVASYDKAIALNPDFVWAHYNRGLALMELKQAEAALASHNRAIALKPDLAEAYNNSGLALMDLKRMEEAIANFDRAIALKPDFAEAHYNRGLALMSLKRQSDALISYSKAVALNPNFAEAYNNSGLALTDLNQLSAALTSYDKAIALKPDFAEAYYNRGNALKGLKQPGPALDCYKKAIALKPDYAEAYNNCGNALRELKRPDEAVASYDKAIALKPDYAEAYNNRGNALSDLKRSDEALKSYDKAIALDPNYADAYYNRGLTLKALKKTFEAQSDLEKVIALQPDHQEAPYHLAAITKQNIPDIAPRKYVVNLFDEYAERFDNHLVNVLQYQTPSILATQFGHHVEDGQYDVLDLGCGTGLSGKAFYDYARRLVGVDLSPRMLEKAKQLNIYDNLVCADIIDFLQQNKESADLIVSADVLIYIGDLTKLFNGVKGALRNNGWFSFSVEMCDGDSFELKSSQRYGHSLQYLKSTAESCGFVIKEILNTTLRKEAGEGVPGYAFLLTKP